MAAARAAAGEGTSGSSSTFSAGEGLIKMESVKVPKVLQELLLSLPSLPKESNGQEVTFVTPDVSSGVADIDWASNVWPNANFLDYFPEVLEVLVMLLTRDDNPVWQLRALHALEGVLESADAKIKEKIVHCPGALTGLLILLANDNNPDFQVRSALIIRELANGNHETKTKLSIHPGALHGLVVSLTKDSNPSLQQNTAKALSILAVGESDNVSKIVLNFVLKGNMIPLENETDSDYLLLDCSRNLIRAMLKAKNTKDVLANVHVQDMRLRIKRMQMEIPSIGEVLESLDTFFQDFEEEAPIKQEEIQGCGTVDIDKVRPRCKGIFCLLWRGRYARKGKVAAVPENKVDEVSQEWSGGKRPGVQLTNHPLPLEVLLMLLSEVFGAEDLLQQRKALRELCDRTQMALDSSAASFISQSPTKPLRGLVSLLASLSLRGLARLALKNLVAGDQQLTATVVGLLISLIGETSLLQESAVWGLGGLAADNDGIKAEIVNEPGALRSLVALLLKDSSYSVRGKAAMALRNLATGDGTIKAMICNCPGALDALVSSLTVDEETIELSWNVNFELQKNAALALGNLACGRRMRTKIVNHPGALAGLVTALTNLWSPALQQNAAFALGNLAVGARQTKSKIIDYPGALLGLTLALKKDRNRNPTLQQHAAFALGSLAGGDEQTKAKILDHPLALQFLLASLNENTNPALQINAARALGMLANGESDTKCKIVNHRGVEERLVLSSLNHDNIGMRRYLKWASKNLAFDDGETMGETTIFNDLWKNFSLRGAIVPNSTRAPARSDI